MCAEEREEAQNGRTKRKNHGREDGTEGEREERNISPSTAVPVSKSKMKKNSTGEVNEYLPYKHKNRSDESQMCPYISQRI